MAKESMKAREVKRAKIVAKYAEKRKALKEAGDYEEVTISRVCGVKLIIMLLDMHTG